MDEDLSLEDVADWLHDIAHVLNEIRVLMITDEGDSANVRSMAAKSLANPSVKFRKLPH